MKYNDVALTQLFVSVHQTEKEGEWEFARLMRVLACKNNNETLSSPKLVVET